MENPLEKRPAHLFSEYYVTQDCPGEWGQAKYLSDYQTDAGMKDAFILLFLCLSECLWVWLSLWLSLCPSVRASLVNC